MKRALFSIALIASTLGLAASTAIAQTPAEIENMGQAGAARAEVVINQFGDSVTPEMEAQLSRRSAATQNLPDLAIVEVDGETLYFSVPSGVDTGVVLKHILTPVGQDTSEVGVEYSTDYEGNGTYGWVIEFTADASPLGLSGLRAQLTEAPEGF